MLCWAPYIVSGVVFKYMSFELVCRHLRVCFWLIVRTEKVTDVSVSDVSERHAGGLKECRAAPVRDESINWGGASD